MRDLVTLVTNDRNLDRTTLLVPQKQCGDAWFPQKSRYYHYISIQAELHYWIDVIGVVHEHLVGVWFMAQSFLDMIKP